MPKQRTIVSLDRQDKEWLDRQAAEEAVPMTELVRRAVVLLRRSTSSTSFASLLQSTRGIWPHGDGLAYQKRSRDEW